MSVKPDPRYYEEVMTIEDPIKSCLVAFVDKEGMKRYFWSRQLSPDASHCDCMLCHQLIGYLMADDGNMEIPLRIWPADGNHGELTFCLACAKKLNVLQAVFGADPL